MRSTSESETLGTRRGLSLVERLWQLVIWTFLLAHRHPSFRTGSVSIYNTLPTYPPHKKHVRLADRLADRLAVRLADRLADR